MTAPVCSFIEAQSRCKRLSPPEILQVEHRGLAGCCLGLQHIQLGLKMNSAVAWLPDIWSKVH